MSRTYRRQRGEKPYTWITHELVCFEEFSKRGRRWRRGLWEYVPRTGKDLKEHLNEYHSDGHMNMNMVPSWFVNSFCNRPFRAKMKQEVRSIMKRAGDYEDYNFDPHKHDALWSWW